VRNGHGAELLIAKSTRSSAGNGLSCQCRARFAALVNYSFWSQTYVHIDKTFTLKNYETFLEKWIYGKLLWRSIKMSAMVTVITILLSWSDGAIVLLDVD
jgi:ABC-type spermidine/putrescine transport system permease subunit I